MLGFSGLTPATRSRADARTHLLEGELLVVGLDTSDVVRRGGIQGLHEQVQGGAELVAHGFLVLLVGDFQLGSRRANVDL